MLGQWQACTGSLLGEKWIVLVILLKVESAYSQGRDGVHGPSFMNWTSIGSEFPKESFFISVGCLLSEGTRECWAWTCLWKVTSQKCYAVKQTWASIFFIVLIQKLNIDTRIYKILALMKAVKLGKRQKLCWLKKAPNVCMYMFLQVALTFHSCSLLAVSLVLPHICSFSRYNFLKLNSWLPCKCKVSIYHWFNYNQHLVS